MRLTLIFLASLIVNSIYDKAVNTYLDNPWAFIGFMFMCLYAAYHDTREREYWAAMVKKMKNTIEIKN